LSSKLYFGHYYYLECNIQTENLLSAYANYHMINCAQDKHLCKELDTN